MKHLKTLLLLVTTLILCGIFIVGFNFLVFLYSTSPSSTPVYIVIPRHASFREVTHILKGKNLISSRLYFLVLGKYKKVTGKIQSGEYMIPPRATPEQLLLILESGKVILHRVTFPEGLTMREMANLLESKSICSAHQFLLITSRPYEIPCLKETFPNLEGVLFPDTYLFPRNYPPRLVIKKMVRRFCQVYTPAMRVRTKKIGMTDRQVITLASMIQKEAMLKREMPIISSVFHNRLKKGMRLQSDPTVIYDIPYFSGKLTRKDLMRPTPHNTYRFKGLPPDPICNPGRDAILAALYPAKTDYLYFVSRNNGTHVFSRTLDEHNIAVLLYQR